MPIEFTAAQKALEHVIMVTFKHYEIPLEISDQIRAAFKSKLWRMGKLLSKLGGTKRRNQLEKWKDSEESIWSFTVGEVEVNRQLLKRKFQVEQELKMEKTKRRKLEIEARELRNMTKSRSKVMSRLLRNADCCSQKKRGSSSKHWNSYSRQHRNSKRKAYTQNIKVATSCCEGHFKPLSMENPKH